MNKNLLAVFLLASFFLSLIICSSSAAVSDNRIYVDDLELLVEQEDSRSAAGGFLGDSSEDLYTEESRIDLLEEECYVLRGKIEALETTISFLENKSSENSRLLSEISKFLSTRELDLNPDERDYDSCMKSISTGSFDEAVGKLSSFLVKYPNSSFFSRASYWLGEMKFANRSFEEAVKCYIKGYEKDPKGEFAPLTLYKMSKAYKELKDIDSSCRVLLNLRGNFHPLSPSLEERVKMLFNELESSGFVCE